MGRANKVFPIPFPYGYIIYDVANKAHGRLEKLPYPHILCGTKPHSHP